MNDVVRERNRRGEGAKLRAEILAGATELLEQTGSEEAVTLRAVARQVGISAPSIYSHFPDREAIVEAIVDGAFADFNAAIKAAGDTVEAGQDPLARLRAGCTAYLRFAAERPNRYRLLFERRKMPGSGQFRFSSLRAQSFDLLIANVQDCVDAGISASADPELAATAIWAALHGLATLHANLPERPWPDTGVLLNTIIYGLAQITGEP